jgi:hypothetical protein
MAKKLSLYALSILLMASCKRPQNEEASVSIQIPTAQEFSAKQNKLQAAAATVEFEKLCFAVNVKGDGIDSKAAVACDIERGIVSEMSVGPGESLSITVDPGSNRTFEIYGFLRDSTSTACPPMIQGWGWPMKKIYSLGSSIVTTLQPGDTELEIDITLPAEARNIAIDRGWASACGGAPTRTASGNALVGAANLSGTGIKFKAHVSEKQSQVKLSAGGITFQGRVHEQ